MPVGRCLTFVILHHVTRDGEHWDLMIQRGETLRTWRLRVGGVPTVDQPVPVQRIGDHRLAYLDYEGPVSGDRGHVRRVDRGRATWRDEERAAAEDAMVQLRGRVVNGVYHFFKAPNGVAMWGLTPRADKDGR